MNNNCITCRTVQARTHGGESHHGPKVPKPIQQHNSMFDHVIPGFYLLIVYQSLETIMHTHVYAYVFSSIYIYIYDVIGLIDQQILLRIIDNIVCFTIAFWLRYPVRRWSFTPVMLAADLGDASRANSSGRSSPVHVESQRKTVTHLQTSQIVSMLWT